MQCVGSDNCPQFHFYLSNAFLSPVQLPFKQRMSFINCRLGSGLWVSVVLIKRTKNSFIHSGHFYSAPSSYLLLRGAPDYSTDAVSEFHAEAHRQLQVKDLLKVPTWRLERESNPHPSG